jgi:hypothetical protein
MNPEQTLQGLKADLTDDASRFDVLEKAFDFRGDCTLTLDDGSTVAGYIFDRRRGSSAKDSVLRLLPPVGEQKINVPYHRVTAIEFGKDTAAGKSFETWIKKYVEKKMKGEQASIESEKLD